MTGGLLLMNKIPGITSFSAINSIKDRVNARKIGHAGTLDRFATGMLAVLTDRFTRLASIFSDLDKEYRADFRFGSETATLDPEGEIVGTGPNSKPQIH